jgi:hypothetical protein
MREQSQPGALRDLLLVGLAELVTPRDGPDRRPESGDEEIPSARVAARGRRDERSEILVAVDRPVGSAAHPGLRALGRAGSPARLAGHGQRSWGPRPDAAG